jgi:NitT/TauT family transport system permease protein
MAVVTSRLKTTIFSLLLYLTVWKLLSLLIGREIILPSPEVVSIRIIRLFRTGDVFIQIAATMGRGLAGFSLSFCLGILCGLGAGKSDRIRWFLNPLIVSIRSIPVLSLILLAVIWFRTDTVPVFICFLVVFPIIAGNVAAGVRQVDPALLEMAQIYGKSRREILTAIYLPSIFPYVSSGLSSGLGLTWKSVVAAEVLSMPSRGMGTAMQTAQLQLDTAVLFSWTVLVVFLAGSFDFLVLLVEKRLIGRYKEPATGRRGHD